MNKLTLKIITLTTILLFGVPYLSGAKEVKLKIEKRYLNFPISNTEQRSKMTFRVDGTPDLSVQIRLASQGADYWVFRDVAQMRGKTITISYDGNQEGLSNILQADTIVGQHNMYREVNRPQFHFTTRRGWINDPNGLIFYQGEYHLFYQHNPYEREWENMHWGHAVSSDLVHWQELPCALFPDDLGGMFSGSAVIDYNNSGGFNRGKTPAMVAFYTAASSEKQVQAMAYSLDNGRTFTKYDKNPIIDSKAKWNSQDTRDPKVFWYAPSKHWVLVLNERDGHSIYTSLDLRNWNYESHTTGFWECPELFELPIDGDSRDTKWVMYGASGTYMLGDFDGKVFTPQAGKYLYTSGSIYAAQTFANIPSTDGRRIQIGWARMSHPGMPFNGMMLMPTELTLSRTKEGIRLVNRPVREMEQLFTPVAKWSSLSSDDANAKLKKYYSADRLRIKTTIKLSHATDAGFNLFAQRIIGYDMNGTSLNGTFYSPQERTSMELSADIYVDRTSIEVFIDGGIYSYSMERRPDQNNKEGFHFWGNNIEVKSLEVFEVESIWK